MDSILFISYDGMTDPLGQSQVLPYLQGLSKKGYNITLLSFEKDERFDKGKELIQAICDDGNITWCPETYTKKPPILSTIKDVRKMRSTALKLHREKDFKAVHCRSYIAALAGLYIKKRTGVPFIFDMRGFWADERVDGQLWQLSNPLYKIIYKYFKKKEKEFLTEAAAIVSLTNNGRNELLSWSDIKQPLPIHVIPCCVDVDLFNPANIQSKDIDSIKTKLSIAPGDIVLSYIGSIGTWYLLEEMLIFFKKWLTIYPDTIFVFVTTDSDKEIYDIAINKNIDKSRIRITGAQRTEVPLLIAMTDYSMFFIKQAYSKKASSPTKQGEIMAMGVPVICNSGVGDTDFVINNYHSGVLIDEFNEDAMLKVIENINKIKFDANEIRKGALEFFSLDNGIEAYAFIYKSLVK